MTRYFLGVDIGATKSHALIADERGHAVSFGEHGAGNYEVVGWDGLKRALHAVVEQALASADMTKEQLAGAGFGIAGYDWPGELGAHLQAIDSLGLSAPYRLVNDTVIGLVPGTGQIIGFHDREKTFRLLHTDFFHPDAESPCHTQGS